MIGNLAARNSQASHCFVAQAVWGWKKWVLVTVEKPVNPMDGLRVECVMCEIGTITIRDS